MQTITYGSVCSGIEAASVAWHPLGFVPTWFAEIEPFPRAVLSHRFPHVADLGDMTKLADQVLVGTVHAPTILVGGTPCQAFSVAGMRAGLSDPRGGLTIKYAVLLDAIDNVRLRTNRQPCIAVWENVPGVLSSKDNAFGCFLAALAGEDEQLVPSGKKWTDAGCVYGPKRAVAWRVLDAQYFGLAQRRRRVFVVASAREGFDPAAVLFEREGVRRDTAPRRGEGQDVAGTLNARTDGGGFPGTDEACSGYVQPVGFEITGPVTACGGTEKKHGFGWGQQEWESGFAIPAALAVHGIQGPCVSDKAFALGRNSEQENAVFAIQDGAMRENPSSGPQGMGVQADIAYTLEARASMSKTQAVCVTGDITHTLKADGFDGSEDGTGRGQPIVTAFAQNQRDEVRTLEVAGALAAEPGMKQQTYLQAGSAVRRLTPVECEKLQGFPPNWTLIPWRGKPASECPDGPRYKAIGNSKAVPVVRWIGAQIKNVLLTEITG